MDRARSVPFYICTYYACVTNKFMRVQCRYLSRISNSASRLLVCNREVEGDPVLKSLPVEHYYERVGRNRSKKVREAKCVIEHARDVSVRACDVSVRASL